MEFRVTGLKKLTILHERIRNQIDVYHYIYVTLSLATWRASHNE